ncbi:MAG: 30S ribosomal protein S21 [bacterium]
MEISVHGDLEKALKLLRRKIQKEGLTKEIKKRRYYEKPSIKLKNKRKQAERRRAKSRARRTVSNV